MNLHMHMKKFDNNCFGGNLLNQKESIYQLF